jgi:hypothetical protein
LRLDAAAMTFQRTPGYGQTQPDAGHSGRIQAALKWLKNLLQFLDRDTWATVGHFHQ